MAESASFSFNLKITVNVTPEVVVSTVDSSSIVPKSLSLESLPAATVNASPKPDDRYKMGSKRISKALILGPRGSGSTSLLKSLLKSSNDRLRRAKGSAHGYDFVVASPTCDREFQKAFSNFRFEGCVGAMVQRFQTYASSGKGCMLLRGAESFSIETALQVAEIGDLFCESNTANRFWQRFVFPVMDAIFVSARWVSKNGDLLRQNLGEEIAELVLREAAKTLAPENSVAYQFYVYWPDSKRVELVESYEYPIRLTRDAFFHPGMR